MRWLFQAQTCLDTLEAVPKVLYSVPFPETKGQISPSENLFPHVLLKKRAHSRLLRKILQQTFMGQHKYV